MIEKLLRLGRIGAILTLLVPGPACAAILSANTTWEGRIELTADTLVPEGVTLTIRPGTTILVASAENTKTDPEYLSPLTEITVRGKLISEGTTEQPVRIMAGAGNRAGSWSGILVDGGEIALAHTSISDADTGVYLYSGAARINACSLTGNLTGIAAVGPQGRIAIHRTTISGNDYGLVQWRGPQIERSELTIAANRKGNERTPTVAPPPAPLPTPPPRPIALEVPDTALIGDTLWSGRIVISGQVRIPEGSRLIIAPGSSIEFKHRDSNRDGIGENGLLIQGVLIAKGTAAQPIIFRSAEATRRPGDWDAVNIMNSDGTRNLVEHCRFEDAYRGLHFHFSHVLVSNSDFRHNYRAIQFQESVVDIVGNRFFANRSGVQGRDSRVQFSDNQLNGNHGGANFLRCTLTFTGNALLANLREGARIREGAATIERNRASGNRIGLQVADLFRGGILANDLAGNTDVGLAMKNVDNLEVSGNHLGGNGLNGLNLQEARVMVRNNLFTANGERGIGIISFSGLITGNTFAANGLYALENEGSDDVDARENWWGGVAPATVILDGTTDPRRGKVRTAGPLTAPPLFTWPLPRIDTDTLWSGRITLPQRATVGQGVTLTVRPGTVVAFGPASGLAVHGRLLANGTADQRITFTAAGKPAAESWDEIILENATDSQLAHCDIEYATWGLHSHFTNLLVSEVTLRHNYGGLRFRSGPVRIHRARVHDNTIGIRSYIGMGEVTESVITNNEIGIFIREKGGSLAIHRNSIAANRNYNLRVGDFNNEDIAAEENWWGSKSGPGETIFDDRQEPGIGRVRYEPYLTNPPSARGTTP